MHRFLPALYRLFVWNMILRDEAQPTMVDPESASEMQRQQFSISLTDMMRGFTGSYSPLRLSYPLLIISFKDYYNDYLIL